MTCWRAILNFSTIFGPRRLWRRSVWITCAIWLCTTPANAQTWRLQFPASPSHGTSALSGYDYLLTPQGGAALPAQAITGASPVSGVITVDVTVYFLTLSPGTYTGIVRALGPGGSTPSPASDPFQITIPAPGAPGKPSFIKAELIGAGELGTALLAYDHGGGAERYDLERDGTVIASMTQPLPFPLAGFPVGRYDLAVTAVYGSARYTSEPLDLTVF